MKIMDAAEIQALIGYHAKAIADVIEDGIGPSKQPILVRTCNRMVELAVLLGECEHEAK